MKPVAPKAWIPPILVAAWIFGMSGCASAPVAPAPDFQPLSVRLQGAGDPQRIGETFPIKTVIDQELTGLEFEAEASRKQLLDQAREFSRYKSGRMTLQEKALRRERCRKGQVEPTFCDESAGNERRASSSSSRRRRTVASPAVTRKILKGDVIGLRGATESDLLAGLKRIESVMSLERAWTALEAADSCQDATLFSTLAMKLEQYFPDPAHRARAERYYTKAVSCSNSFASARAAYRLSLHLITDNRCKEAEPNLKLILSQPEARDYHSRTIYWLSQCASSSSERKEWTARLLAEFPFSLHALLIGKDEILPLVEKDSSNEPRVIFRSRVKPELGPNVRIVEAMQASEGGSVSLPFLEDLIREAKGTEPEFQLYLAVLLRRAGDNIRKFQLLSILLRENPSLLSQSTMRLLYPLHQFELIRNHEAEADPWLVISLIRQESAFNTRARSPAGAMGLMQLMPATARRMERVSRSQLFEPTTNVRLGVRFFAKLLERYNGNAELALAAYNAGPDRVDEWLKRYPISNPMLFVDLIPFKETREYVASIARNYFWYSKLYEQQEGFEALPKARSQSAFALFRPASND